MLLEKEETSNPEAFQLYLKGRYYWNKRNGESIRKGIEYFQQAIEKDPNYAMAYVGLADSYNVLPFYSFARPMDTFPKGKAAANKALQIDETNAEAHASLAGYLQDYDWNYQEAEKELKRAIALNPNYAIAHQWYSELLVCCLNRPQESLVEIKRAVALDPLSMTSNSLLGVTYRRIGKPDEAINQLKKSMELDPDFARVYYALAQTYVQKGMLPEALTEMQTYISKADYGQGYQGDLAYLYAVLGRKTEAYQLIDQLKKLRKTKYIPAIQFASAYAGLGNKDEVFRYLDEAVLNHDIQLAYIKTNVFLKTMHSDPRFNELLRKINLK
jgi:Tfp pilus assembly protein PilF